MEELNAELIPVADCKETVNDAELSPGLSEQESVELHDILSEFTAIFSDVPKITVQHTVRTVADDPVHKKHYPIPYALRDQVKTEIEKMISAVIIEASDSPYASPVVSVKKKDSTLRCCVDYRDLNSITCLTQDQCHALMQC